MKKIFFLFLIIALTVSIYGQQKAVTETGQEVILFEDGSWIYQNKKEALNNEIPTNSRRFSKNKKSTFLLKSKKFNVGIYLDPKLWSFNTPTDNPEAEYELQLKDGDLYGLIITEKVEIPIETLKVIALENAKAAAPNMSIVKEEFRNVNGLKVLLLHMNGTIQGIKFSYYGYYYSNSNGTVQLITYTSQNLLDGFKPKIEDLLNGIVELN